MYSKIITHDGVFHADDVFAVALANEVCTMQPEIIRTRDPKILRQHDTLILDVGGDFVIGLTRTVLDHHQPGFTLKRGNGVPFATFGLAWSQTDLGMAYVRQRSASATVSIPGTVQYIDRIQRMTIELVDAWLVAPIDSRDTNTPERTLVDAAVVDGIPVPFAHLSEIIGMMNPTREQLRHERGDAVATEEVNHIEGHERELAFRRAVGLAAEILGAVTDAALEHAIAYNQLAHGGPNLLTLFPVARGLAVRSLIPLSPRFTEKGARVLQQALEERCAGDDENSWKLFELWHPEGAKAEPGCEWTLKSIAAAVEDEGQLFSIVGCPNSESDPDGPHTWRVIISPEYARRANGWWQVTEPETRHLPTRTKLLTFCHTSMRIFGTRTSDPSVVCEWIRALEEIAGSTVAKAVDSVPRPRHRGPVEAGST